MSTQAWAVAKADFQERMRRAPVYMTMGVAAFLCYLAYTDKATVTMENGRGVWNTAWSASSLAILATSFVTLVGFFIVRNAVQREEETRVGQLVATSTVSNFSYLSGKLLSNFAVLLTIVSVFVVWVPIVQWGHHAGFRFSLGQLANPFLYITVPAAAFVAAVAVLFECHPWLKRGVGNIVYVFAWTEMIREAGMDNRPWTDMVGFYSFMQNTHAVARAQGVSFPERSLNVGHAEFDHWSIFVWNGFPFAWRTVLLRAEWFVVAIVLIAIATYFFKRFDIDARPALRLRAPRFFRKAQANSADSSSKWDFDLVRLGSAHSGEFGTRFLALVGAELRLLLHSIPRFAYAIFALANFVALVAPRKDGPGEGVLAFLWIVPVILWSNMGAREQAPFAGPLIFSAPHSFLRQLPAEWMAGCLVALGVSAGVGLRLAFARDYSHLAVWLTGAMFISSLAIACGTWSRSARLFQGLYTGWWYLGLNNVPNMDFTGITGQRHAIGYLIFSLALLGSALAQRWWYTERAAAYRALGIFGKNPRPSREPKVAVVE